MEAILVAVILAILFVAIVTEIIVPLMIVIGVMFLIDCAFFGVSFVWYKLSSKCSLAV